jgi:hypothetical protein
MSGALGYGKSKSVQQQTSESTTDASSSTFIDPNQQAGLSGLRDDAGFLSEFGRSGGGSGPFQAFGQKLLEGATSAGNTRGQIDFLREELNRNLFENLMPNIASKFGVQGGGAGRGSRELIESESATGRTQTAFAGGITDILERRDQRMIQAAQLLPGLFDLGLQGTTQPLLAAGQLIGAPTILSKSKQTGRAQSQGTGSSSSINLSIAGGI